MDTSGHHNREHCSAPQWWQHAPGVSLQEFLPFAFHNATGWRGPSRAPAMDGSGRYEASGDSDRNSSSDPREGPFSLTMRVLTFPCQEDEEDQSLALCNIELGGPASWSGNTRKLGAHKLGFISNGGKLTDQHAICLATNLANVAETMAACALDSSARPGRRWPMHSAHEIAISSAPDRFETILSAISGRQESASVSKSLLKLGQFAQGGTCGFVDVVLIQVKQALLFWTRPPVTSTVASCFLRTMQLETRLPLIELGSLLFTDPSPISRNNLNRDVTRLTAGLMRALQGISGPDVAVIVHVDHEAVQRIGSTKIKDTVLGSLNQAHDFGGGWHGHAAGQCIFLDNREPGVGIRTVNPHLRSAYLTALSAEAPTDGLHERVLPLMKAMSEPLCYTSAQGQWSVLACLTSAFPGFFKALRKNITDDAVSNASCLAFAVCRFLGMPATVYSSYQQACAHQGAAISAVHRPCAGPHQNGPLRGWTSPAPDPLEAMDQPDHDGQHDAESADLARYRQQSSAGTADTPRGVVVVCQGLRIVVLADYDGVSEAAKKQPQASVVLVEMLSCSSAPPSTRCVCKNKSEATRLNVIATTVRGSTHEVRSKRLWHTSHQNPRISGPRPPISLLTRPPSPPS